MKNAGMVMIAIFLMVLYAHCLFAQGPDTLWTRIYGGANDDQAYSVQQTFDGGYIIAGYTKSFGAGNSDIYLVRTDSIGNTLWTRTYGDTLFDAAYSVKQTADSGFIVAGTKQTSTYPNIYGYLIKTDKNGDSLWAKTYNWTPYEVARFYSVDKTSDGGYIATGFMYVYKNGDSFQAESNDWHQYEETGFPEKPNRGDLILLVKTDTDGNVVWHKEYTEGYSYSVKQTPEGGYIVAGCIPYGVFLLKAYPNGDTTWTKNYSGPEAEFGYSVELSADNGYIIVGSTFNPLPFSDVFIIGTDSLGDTLWTRLYGGADTDQSFSVQKTYDEHYIIAGRTQCFGSGSDDVYLLKVDENGDTIWTRAYGWTEADVGYCGQQTADSGYIVAGYTRSFGGSDWDVLLLKTQPDVGIEEKEEPKEIKQDIRFFAQPNPFTTFTTITILGISENQNIRESELKIFDLTGRRVREISLLPFNFSLEVTWDGKDGNGINVPGGIYLVRLQTGNHTSMHKVILLK
jgi:hypothetical protein